MIISILGFCVLVSAGRINEQDCHPRCIACSRDLCNQCEDGYYVDPNFVCSQCNQSGCTCNTMYECSGCIDGYYFSNDTCYQCSSRCTNCPVYDCCYVGCTSCSLQGYCSDCAVGYYLNDGRCLSCPSKCKACAAKYQCKECVEGYTVNNGVCCSSGCSSCSLHSKCSDCIPGFYLSDDICKYCQVGCMACTGQDQCSDCSNGNGYYLSDGQCYYCGDGYYVANGVCTPCQTGCKTCTGDICLECLTGYFLSNSHDGICCPSTCTSCLYENECTSCINGYHGADCSNACSSKCLNNVCDKDTGNCIYGCMAGYYGQECNIKCQESSGSCDGCSGISCSEDGNANKDAETNSGPSVVTIAVGVIVPVALVVLLVVLIFCIRRYRSNTKSVKSEVNIPQTVAYENTAAVDGPSNTGYYNVDLTGEPNVTVDEDPPHVYEELDEVGDTSSGYEIPQHVYLELDEIIEPGTDDIKEDYINLRKGNLYINTEEKLQAELNKENDAAEKDLT